MGVDTMLDDGKPNTGKVRAGLGTGVVATTIAASTDTAYIDNGSNIHTVCMQF
jgi:hypothetical protein